MKAIAVVSAFAAGVLVTGFFDDYLFSKRMKDASAMCESVQAHLALKGQQWYCEKYTFPVKPGAKG